MNLFTADDHAFMARALQLAERGLETTSPNPRVGCVLVRDGRVVGEGWHEFAGGPHAEIVALREAGSAVQGATAYVTLEPCSHHGRTPPCADALVAAGVARVVAAMEDPNPKVAGNGLARLRAAGVQVASGLMAAQAEALNPGFAKRMRSGLPYVRVKSAMSLDGRTAMASGESKWITSEAARLDVQHLRARSCAIVTGVGTVLADDPAMTVRLPGHRRQPLRVVVDAQLRTPPAARILRGGALLATLTRDTDEALAAAGATLVPMPAKAGRVDLEALLRRLAEQEVNEVLVEAGAVLAGAFVSAGLVDELVIYLAPKLMGHGARGLFELPGLNTMAQALPLTISDVRAVGRDWRVTARVTSR
ncbi:MAG: bifunctional diaminohydroxyphosphoribosylaminopyrimidine deaminase/5-amino-6-(5-phosphoribosylamino)uracil reductase RibD [Thiohalomonadaceae bacterium]